MRGGCSSSTAGRGPPGRRWPRRGRRRAGRGCGCRMMPIWRRSIGSWPRSGGSGSGREQLVQAGDRGRAADQLAQRVDVRAGRDLLLGAVVDGEPADLEHGPQGCSQGLEALLETLLETLRETLLETLL